MARRRGTFTTVAAGARIITGKTQYVRRRISSNSSPRCGQDDLNELGVRYKLEQEIDRYQKFEQSVMRVPEAQREDTKTKDVNLRNYIKYLLKEGSFDRKARANGVL